MNLNEVDILYSAEEISQTVKRLGREINTAYAGQELLVVGILRGCFIFMADLVRTLEVTLQIDFIDISSYGNHITSSGEVRIQKDLSSSIEGRHVLVVEDIIDSGLTLGYLLNILLKRHPASLRTCCLLDKPSRRKNNIKPDFTGYIVEDQFIVGYGLDYAERYREYPALCILQEHVYTK